MENQNMIKGYNGIMDLDVSNMDPKYVNQAILQHNNDIKNYIREQNELKTEMRYENTILRINKLHKMDTYYLQKRTEQYVLDQNKKTDIYNSAKKK
tara:strand:- start:7472 stop:7759 length:288 start_codon:yes stop_codon:yes gene_type:complete